MKNNFLTLTVLLTGIFSAQAKPVRRDTTPTTVDQSVVKYVDQSGKIDYASLYADTAASPVVVSIAVSGTAAAPVQTAALAASASEGATQSLVSTTVAQPTGTPSRRSVVKQQKRDVTPAWNSETCPSPGKTEGIDISTWDAAGFSGNSWLSSLYAQNAGAPDGFARVYVGANGIPIGKTTSITQAITALESYDVDACKSACDYYSCQAFSVFAVRDTEVDFSTVDLTQCNNPPPVLKFNCAVYGSKITKDMIKETGQMKGNYFETAIAAANGYVRESIDKVIDGYTNTVLNGGTTSNGDTAQYLIDIYNPNENPNTVGYSPDLCAARCTANDQCQGFDAAQTLADGNFVGTQCLLYNKAIDSSEGNNAGQWGNDGKWYSFQPSVFYAKNSVPTTLPPAPSFNGAVCTLDSDSKTYTCNYKIASNNQHNGLVSTFVAPCLGKMSVKMAGGSGGNTVNNGGAQSGVVVSSAVQINGNANIKSNTIFDVVLGGTGYSPYYEQRVDGGFNGGGAGSRTSSKGVDRFSDGAGGGGYSVIRSRGTDLVIAGGGAGNGYKYGQAGKGTSLDNYVNSGYQGADAAFGSQGGGGGGGLLGGVAGTSQLGGNWGKSLADQILGTEDTAFYGPDAYATITFTCSS